MSEKMISIGKIVAPHGVRGDVRVIPLTDFPERFQILKKVYTDNGILLDVEHAKQHKQFILLKLRGYNSINDVEKLRNRILQVERKDAFPLPEGHYYQFDIIGLAVQTVDGEHLGIVTDILETGSNDVYVTEKEDGKPLLIPAIKDVVKTIDLKAGIMVVKLQEEWE